MTHHIHHIHRVLTTLVFVVACAFTALAQTSGGDAQQPPSDQKSLAVPDSERLRVGVRAMAALVSDGAIASLGFERQGRVGYAIVDLTGRISDRVSYRLEINPVNETRPLPSCGEEFFFYPNDPRQFDAGPNVPCDPDGRLRVDDYRFLALDLIPQQGPIRQAYLHYSTGRYGIRFGRFIVPIGFGWEEVGSFTSKDATHIQRINANASFGAMITLSGRRGDDSLLGELNLVGFLGEGNRNRDYTYFYFVDPSLDSNSALSAVVSGRVMPIRGVELRAAYQYGDTGSKVERLPNFYASKRHDNAVVLSGRYQPVSYLKVFGEYARYTWGLRETSAELLGLNQDPVVKPGYYAGVDVSAPVRRGVRVGAVVTREELTRDDSLVKLMSERGLFEATMGKKERSVTARLYADFGRHVTVALFRNDLSNPFPWLSGITPVGGPRAFQPDRGSDKFGLVVRFRVP